MKALGLSFSLFVFASLAAPPAEAHFRGGFHPSARIGPTHGGDLRNGFRRQRNQQGGSGSDWSALPDTPGDDTAPGGGPPQYAPAPFPVARPLLDWALDAFAPSADPDRRTAATARPDAQGGLRRPPARGGRPPLTPMRGRAYACAASRPDDRRLRAEESPGSTRTRRRITSGGGDPRDSATESKPPAQSSKGRGR